MNLYILLQIIISSIVATSVMTLFSYAVSAAAREIYKEPVLLTYVLHKANIDISSKTKIILGWFLHYLIGFLFVLVYHLLWYYEFLEISWTVSILFGVISGIIGIVSWIILFEIIPQKPNIDYKGYYIQLLLAHVIFAVSSFMVYKVFL
ncbi:hypothetical protein [Flavobacterium sp. ENC]|uniref:hypothetical protein n=1 Tax=Flavobacterium sp. ENC TaxID=2897330 RepID=UPI001E2895AB|nr:hypothetical protein [Flavobacterium sp. ENC]MCD0467286.1 hypothetical protein [Flavobacterium sp. ENC]